MGRRADTEITLHLLLLTQVKIWDVFNGGKCMRTYLGHAKVGLQA
jgi:hypothetical protein